MFTEEIQGQTAEQEQFAYDVNVCREDYILEQIKHGRSIITPKDNELLIDIDSEEDFKQFEEGIDLIQRNISEDIKITNIHPSKSGLPRRHITVTLPFDTTPVERIAWQAALGSDFKRELLSLIRYLRGDIKPTLFVE